MKASILTLVAAAALACGSQVAQAHLLLGDGAVVGVKSTSSKTSSLAAMTAAGIRYHAAANYKNEQRLFGTTPGVRPDNRPGPRGV
jgi:hypothetical protein